MSAAEKQDAAAGTAVFYEEILERCCGGSGRWQILLAAYLSLMWFLLPGFSMSMMFVGATPEFRCADGSDANATFASLPADTPQCHPPGDNSSACTRWVFDDSVYQSTVTTEWSLVCGRKPLLSMLQSWLMIGGIIGALVTGQLADRFGRRTVFLPAMVLVTACAFAAALVTNYTAFAAIRLLTGFGLTTMIAGHYVLVTELGGVGQRAALSTVYLLPFAIGVMLVAAASYAIRVRWLLQLAFAAPWLLFLPSFWVMPESPRWLVVQGRFEQAYRVLSQGARWNGRHMPAKEEVLRLMKAARDGMQAREAALRGTVGVTALQRALQLVRTPRMRRNTLTIVSIGFVISASFYGISFDVTQLSESPHLAGVLSGLVEVPSYLIFPLLNWLGRRRSMAAFLFSTSVHHVRLARRDRPRAPAGHRSGGQVRRLLRVQHVGHLRDGGDADSGAGPGADGLPDSDQLRRGGGAVRGGPGARSGPGGAVSGVRSGGADGEPGDPAAAGDDGEEDAGDGRRCGEGCGWCGKGRGRDEGGRGRSGEWRGWWGR